MKQIVNSPEPILTLSDLNALVEKALTYVGIENADASEIDCKPLTNFSGRITGLNLKPLKDAR